MPENQNEYWLIVTTPMPHEKADSLLDDFRDRMSDEGIHIEYGQLP